MCPGDKGPQWGWWATKGTERGAHTAVRGHAGWLLFSGHLQMGHHLAASKAARMHQCQPGCAHMVLPVWALPPPSRAVARPGSSQGRYLS